MPAKHCAYGTCCSDNRYAHRPDMENVHFLSFPKPHKDLEKCRKWVRACAREGFCVDRVTKYTYICSKHFVGGNGPTDQHPDPIPANYTPQQTVKFSRKRATPRSRTGSSPPCKRPLQPAAGIDPPSVGAEQQDHSYSAVATEEDKNGPDHLVDQAASMTITSLTDKDTQTSPIIQDTDESTPSVSVKEAGNQTQFVCSGLMAAKVYTRMCSNFSNSFTDESVDKPKCDLLFHNLSCDEKKFQYYTGLDLIHFNHLFSSFGDSVNHISYWRGDSSKNSSECKVLSKKDQLLLTIIRLRRNFPMTDLSYRYNVSIGTVSCIVTTWIQFLYVKFISLKDYIFPCRQVMKPSLPPVFRNFKNVRVIVDCFEVFTEKSSDYGEQGNMFSSYKGHNTLKVLLGVSPTGAVVFLSDAFEGSISDRDIVSKSGFLDQLNPGDLVLADRGFTIKDLVMNRKAHLNIPPFLGKRDKFTKQEDILTRSIARTRIHVERSVGRLREFRILNGVIPLSMKHLASQIVFVVGMLSNYQPPLVS